jgi:hypothetical protein
MMPRFWRCVAWLTFWPAGACLSLRHGADRRRAKERAHVVGEQGPSNPTAVRDLSDIFFAHGIRKHDALLMTVKAMDDVHAGVSVSEAARRQLIQRTPTP